MQSFQQCSLLVLWFLICIGSAIGNEHSAFLDLLDRRAVTRTAPPEAQTFPGLRDIPKMQVDAEDSLRFQQSFGSTIENFGTTSLKYDARAAAPLHSMDDVGVDDVVCSEHGLYLRASALSADDWEAGHILVSGIDWKCAEDREGPIYRQIRQTPLALREDVVFVRTGGDMPLTEVFHDLDMKMVFIPHTSGKNQTAKRATTSSSLWGFNYPEITPLTTLHTGLQLSCTECYAYLEAGFIFEMSWSWSWFTPRIKNWRLIFFGDFKFSANPSAATTFSDSHTFVIFNDLPIATVKFIVGVIPVWIDFSGDMNVRVELEATAQITADFEVTAETGIKFGFEYTPATDFQPVQQLSPPVLETDRHFTITQGTAEIAIFCEISLNALLYGVAGVAFELIPYAGIHMEFNSPQCTSGPSFYLFRGMNLKIAISPIDFPFIGEVTLNGLLPKDMVEITLLGKAEISCPLCKGCLNSEIPTGQTNTPALPSTSFVIAAYGAIIAENHCDFWSACDARVVFSLCPPVGSCIHLGTTTTKSDNDYPIWQESFKAFNVQPGTILKSQLFDNAISEPLLEDTIELNQSPDNAFYNFEPSNGAVTLIYDVKPVQLVTPGIWSNIIDTVYPDEYAYQQWEVEQSAERFLIFVYLYNGGSPDVFLVYAQDIANAALPSDEQYDEVGNENFVINRPPVDIVLQSVLLTGGTVFDILISPGYELAMGTNRTFHLSTPLPAQAMYWGQVMGNLPGGFDGAIVAIKAVGGFPELFFAEYSGQVTGRSYNYIQVPLNTNTSSLEENLLVISAESAILQFSLEASLYHSLKTVGEPVVLNAISGWNYIFVPVPDEVSQLVIAVECTEEYTLTAVEYPGGPVTKSSSQPSAVYQSLFYSEADDFPLPDTILVRLHAASASLFTITARAGWNIESGREILANIQPGWLYTFELEIDFLPQGNRHLGLEVQGSWSIEDSHTMKLGWLSSPENFSGCGFADLVCSDPLFTDPLTGATTFKTPPTSCLDNPAFCGIPSHEVLIAFRLDAFQTQRVAFMATYGIGVKSANFSTTVQRNRGPGRLTLFMEVPGIGVFVTVTSPGGDPDILVSHQSTKWSMPTVDFASRRIGNDSLGVLDTMDTLIVIEYFDSLEFTITMTPLEALTVTLTTTIADSLQLQSSGGNITITLDSSHYRFVDYIEFELHTTQHLLEGITGGQWDSVIRPLLGCQASNGTCTAIQFVNPQQITISLPPVPSYDISKDLILSVVLPADVLLPPVEYALPNILPIWGSCSSLILEDPLFVPQSIPDGESYLITPSLSTSALPNIIVDVEVAVSISHTYIGDLTIILVFEDELGAQTSVALIDRPGVPDSIYGCNSANINAVYGSVGESTAEDTCMACYESISVCAAQSGSIVSLESFGSFIGEPVKEGAWVLFIFDAFAGDQGTLESWNMTIRTSCNEPGATTETSTTGGAVTTDWNLCQISLDDPFFVPQAIPDGGSSIKTPSLSTYALPNLILDVEVAVSIPHTYIGDLMITLWFQDALGAQTSVALFDRPGVPPGSYGCIGHNINAVYGSVGESIAEDTCMSCAQSITMCAAQSGSIVSFESFDPFIGQPVKEGIWWLHIADVASGDQGILESWNLTITINCDEPAGTTGTIGSITGAATTGEATTGVATTGVATTGVATTGVATTGVATTGVATTGVATTGVATTGVATTGVATTDVATTNVATTGVATTGVATTNVATTGVATTGVATTTVETTDVAITDGASTEVAITELVTTGVATTSAATTGAAQTGLATTVATTGMAITDVATTGVATTGVATTLEATTGEATTGTTTGVATLGSVTAPSSQSALSLGLHLSSSMCTIAVATLLFLSM